VSKKFYRYEDVPLMLASKDDDPVLIFANNVSLGVNQQINVKKFTDDYRISIGLQTGDVFIASGERRDFVLGPRNGPGVPISESLEVAKSGQKIIFPSGQSIYLTSDAEPGDYYISVEAREDTLLRYEEDLEYGELEVLRSYAADYGVKGTLNVDYYMNTGNMQSFFDLTGLSDINSYPQVDESPVSGSFGDYKFDHAYLREISFDARAFEPVSTRAVFDVFGTLEYVEGLSEQIINSDYGCNVREQLTVPHGLRTTINGADSIGMESPIGFSYSISCQRNPEYNIPIKGNDDQMGELPVRVTKENVDVEVRIDGEKLDPYLKITGQRAEISVSLSDIGFRDDFSDNNFGELKNFNLVGNLVYPEPVPEILASHGVMESDTLSVGVGGYLRGSASIKQSFR
tara:strand:+ start:1395 stop:2597 length:1203 start_codon:yes stop_codon:yes gene_type:complete